MAKAEFAESSVSSNAPIAARVRKDIRPGLSSIVAIPVLPALSASAVTDDRLDYEKDFWGDVIVLTLCASDERLGSARGFAAFC